MTVPSPTTGSPSVLQVEHRGWKLQVNWFRSFAGAPQGWVCYATAPESTHSLNIGRWRSSDEALEHGRAYVDRSIDTPARTPSKLSVQRRR